jgi:hypothetical protein
MTNGEAQQISTGSEFFGVRITASTSGTYVSRKTGEVKEARRGVSLNIQGNWMPLTATSYLVLVGAYSKNPEFAEMVNKIAAEERKENGF